MPVHENLELQRDAYVSSDEILERISTGAQLQAVPGPQGNGPARYFAFPGALGAVGVISPLSHDYCGTCNRVRLTADGRLRLCLFGDHALDLRTPLRAGASMEELAGLLGSAMLIKPARHHLRLGETASRMRAFSEIGGSGHKRRPLAVVQGRGGPRELRNEKHFGNLGCDGSNGDRAKANGSTRDRAPNQARTLPSPYGG